jgi:hypothetical protein
MSFRSILLALQHAEVRFVLIGGVAASIQGSARVTNDLDICYDTADDNRGRLATALRTMHAELRGAEPGLPFVLDARTLRDCPLLTLSTTEGFLDVLDHIPGVGRYDDAARVAERITWDGVTFDTLSLDALIAAKRACGRPKDREHLVELEAIRATQEREQTQDHQLAPATRRLLGIATRAKPTDMK